MRIVRAIVRPKAIEMTPAQAEAYAREMIEMHKSTGRFTLDKREFTNFDTVIWAFADLGCLVTWDRDAKLAVINPRAPYHIWNQLSGVA